MTHSRRPGGRLVRAFAAALMLAGAITAADPAAVLAAPAGTPASTLAAQAGGCENWTGTQPPSPSALQDILFGVAIQSACDVWAVGFYSANGMTRTLTEHWDGSTWTVVPSPDPGSANNELRGVRGSSPSDVWAVGSYGDGNTGKSLILHWDGHTWTQVTSPNPGSEVNDLLGVRALSGTDAWAVGDTVNGTGVQTTLILHWDGNTWKRVSS